MSTEQPDEKGLREAARLKRFTTKARNGLEDLIDLLWGLGNSYAESNPLVLDPSAFFRGGGRQLERLTRAEQRVLGQILIARLHLRDELSLRSVREYEIEGGHTRGGRGDGSVHVAIYRSRMALTGDDYQPSYLDPRGMTVDTEDMDPEELERARILHMHRIVYSDGLVGYGIGPNTDIA
jgi:hypothetical protein